VDWLVSKSKAGQCEACLRTLFNFFEVNAWHEVSHAFDEGTITRSGRIGEAYSSVREWCRLW
jgi:hypothetical protein